jgi:hypothetical protein
MPYSGARAMARRSRSSRSASLSDGAKITELGEVPLQARGRDGTQQPRRHPRCVAERVGGSGRDVGRLTGLQQDRRKVARTYLHRALEDPEALLEVVTVWRGSTARRDEHVQHREAASSLLAGEQHGVGVADDGQVRQRRVLRARNRHLSEVILGRRGHGASRASISANAAADLSPRVRDLASAPSAAMPTRVPFTVGCSGRNRPEQNVLV